MTAMTREEILARVTQALAKHLAIDEARIRPDSHVVDDLGVDSFGMVELLFELEDATGVQITGSDQPRLITPGDMADLIFEKLNSKPPSVD